MSHLLHLIFRCDGDVMEMWWKVMFLWGFFVYLNTAQDWSNKNLLSAAQGRTRAAAPRWHRKMWRGSRHPPAVPRPYLRATPPCVQCRGRVPVSSLGTSVWPPLFIPQPKGIALVWSFGLWSVKGAHISRKGVSFFKLCLLHVRYIQPIVFLSHTKSAPIISTSQPIVLFSKKKLTPVTSTSQPNTMLISVVTLV